MADAERATPRSAEESKTEKREIENVAYYWRIVIHLAQELAQASLLLGWRWCGGHGIDIRRERDIVVTRGLSWFRIHIDILFDRSIKVWIRFHGRIGCAFDRSSCRWIGVLL